VLPFSNAKILQLRTGGYVEATPKADGDDQVISRSVLEDVFRPLAIGDHAGSH